MSKCTVLGVLLLSAIGAWAQGTPAGHPEPGGWPTIATVEQWSLEPTRFIGVQLGVPVREQTEVRACEDASGASAGVCYEDAPKFSRFRNRPDLGFPYHIDFLMRGEVVEGVQLTFPKASRADAFRYALRAFGAPTSQHSFTRSKNEGGGRTYIWSGTNTLMVFVEFARDPKYSSLSIATTKYLDSLPDPAK